MRIRITMLIFAVLSSYFVFPQNPILNEASSEIEKAAEAITTKYVPELALSGKQMMPFQLKVTEFLMRKSEVDDSESYTTKEKLRLIRRLSKQETAAMRNVLTNPQFRKYRKIKRAIQPLYVVVE